MTTKKQKTKTRHQVRKRKPAYYRHFRLSKRIESSAQKNLPSVRTLVRAAWQQIWRNKRLFFGLTAIYLLLNIALVRGLANTIDINSLRDDLAVAEVDGIALHAALLGTVVSSAGGAATEAGGLYQSFLLLVFALAFIWLLRQTSEPTKERLLIRQPLYEGMQPLIPFIMVMLVVSLQLLPMLAGLGLFGIVQANGLAVTAVEQGIWVVLVALLTLLTFYMLSSSLMALMIITLPGTRPLTALRMARKVVAYRRWPIMRKILLLSLVVVFIYLLILFAIIMVAPWLAEWVVSALSALSLPIVLASFYKLYRSLI